MLMQHTPQTDFGSLKAGPVTPAAAKWGNVRIMVCALYCPDIHNGPSTALPFLQKLKGTSDLLLGTLPTLESAGTLDACLAGAGGPAKLLLLENADALVDLDDLGVLSEWGIATVGLTHACRNRLACGNGVTDPEGLTATGRRLARELDQLGMIIDVAHLARPGFNDLVLLIDSPLVSSHTGLRRFCDTDRNLADDQLELILGRGGCIGLSLAPEMLSSNGRADLEMVVRQLDWLVQRFGPDGIAIGSDFGGFTGRCRGIEDCGAFPKLAAKLLELGYPERSVASIFGGNWQRFYQSRLPAAPRPGA